MHSPRALDLSPPGGGANRPQPLPPHLGHGTSPPPSATATPISHHPDDHEGTVSPPAFQQPPVSAAAAFIAAAAAAAAASTSPTSDHENNHNSADRPRIRNRRGRGGRSSRSERMSAAIGSGSPRSLSEMSVRGLDLLRYATMAPDGTYRLILLVLVQKGAVTFVLFLPQVFLFLSHNLSDDS